MKKTISRMINKRTNNELLPPLSGSEICEFEKNNGIMLPKDYVEILKTFDGGEILIPGPQIFGLKESEIRKSIREANNKKTRNSLSIPKNYLIIAKLNFGDFICINLNQPFDVIQWDHENDQLFCTWNSLEEWLIENIDLFEEFEEQTS